MQSDTNKNGEVQSNTPKRNVSLTFSSVQRVRLLKYRRKVDGFKNLLKGTTHFFVHPPLCPLYFLSPKRNVELI